MTVAVFAAAPPAPPPGPNPWPGIRQAVQADDGTIWELTGRAGGVWLHACRGMHMPDEQIFSDTAAGVAGSRFRGSRTSGRDVYWDLRIYDGDGTQTWIDRDRAFWAALHPGRTVQWIVTQPNGQERRLTCRLLGTPERLITTDPGKTGWGRYDLYLSSDDPYWHGPDIVVTGGGNDGTPFIDGAGPPFYIAGGSLLSGMAVPNPGDVEAWPVWEAVGPHPDLVVGLGSTIIECPPLSAGEHLVIDTSPWVRTILVDDVDALDDTGTADFTPIPAGGSSTLAVSSSGSGTVTCRVSPRYYRAW